MAAGILSKPGTKFGPCLKPCEHRDCVATRRIAQTNCHRCGKPIGFDVGFYDDPIVHALCEEKAIEADEPRRGA